MSDEGLPTFDIYPYSRPKLEALLTSYPETAATISSKLHLEYFAGYFGDLNAKLIVVERRYVDRDFLEDYAAYYVRCFADYKRYCDRLHFFCCDIAENQLRRVLQGENDAATVKALSEGYLGFVVAKPLPTTVVGRTCLITYPSAGRRYFPNTRDYDAHLFGIDLTIRNTLAFQEQDNVVAACATSALWSVFQGTGKLFQHPIPSPVEITKAAAERLPSSTRLLPNRGLNLEMMAHAIRSVGLEPLWINGAATAADHYTLKGAAYAYLQGHIPMILGITLIDTTRTPATFMGKHAVALTGYSLGDGAIQPYGSTGFRLRASRIDKFYVHDDQVGPFARMGFDGAKFTYQQQPGQVTDPIISISTSWRGDNGVIGSGRALSEMLLIPLYHKIRVPFSMIHDGVLLFDSFASKLLQAGPEPLAENLEWDIFLTTVIDVKKGIRENKALPANRKATLLTRPFPRFIWCATALAGDNKVFDLLFDATDIEQGQCLVDVVEHDQKLSEILHEVFSDENVETLLGNGHRFAAAIARWFRMHPFDEMWN
ncbi:MAG: hypothetical protein ABIK08_18280 [Pseudomonadota bacterium]